MTIVLATRNAHKVREFASLLDGLDVVALPDDVDLPPETGETFADNALAKARAAATTTGRPAIADDSGVQAAALGGAPGVRSARFAGEDADDAANLAKLLREAPAGSPLAYVCAIAWVDGDEERLFEGRCTGTLAAQPRGAGGFGYDPAFLPDDVTDGRTMAELSPAEKDAISHRGRAAAALRAWLSARRRAGRDDPPAGRLDQQIDRRTGADREEHGGVALIAREQQRQAGQQARQHGDEPGDPREAHRVIVAGAPDDSVSGVAGDLPSGISVAPTRASRRRCVVRAGIGAVRGRPDPRHAVSVAVAPHRRASSDGRLRGDGSPWHAWVCVAWWTIALAVGALACIASDAARSTPPGGHGRRRQTRGEGVWALRGRENGLAKRDSGQLAIRVR